MSILFLVFFQFVHDKAAHNQDSHNGAQFRQIDVTAGAQPKPSSQNRNKNTHYSHFVFPFYPFNLRAAHQHTLPEVPRRAPEQPHIVLAGNVAVEAGAGALAVAHLFSHAEPRLNFRFQL